MTYTGIGETQRTGSGTTKYQYDGTGLSKQTDSLGDTYFTSLPDGTLLSETVPSGSAAGTYYYLSDGAGSVAAVTNSSGAISDSYSYDPLGAATSSGSVPNPYTFGGGSYDSTTGFYYTGNGYYDPATGQSFGCKDKGWVDPGEDLCGEEENFTPPAYRDSRSFPYNQLGHQGDFTASLTGVPRGSGKIFFRVTTRVSLLHGGTFAYDLFLVNGTTHTSVDLHGYSNKASFSLGTAAVGNGIIAYSFQIEKITFEYHNPADEPPVRYGLFCYDFASCEQRYAP